MSVTIRRPDHTDSTSVFSQVVPGVGNVNAHQVVQQGVDTPNDSSYLVATNTPHRGRFASAELDIPADFGQATECRLRFRHRGNTAVNSPGAALSCYYGEAAEALASTNLNLDTGNQIRNDYQLFVLPGPITEAEAGALQWEFRWLTSGSGLPIPGQG